MTNLPPTIAFGVILAAGIIATAILHGSLLHTSLESGYQPIRREGGAVLASMGVSALNTVQQAALDAFVNSTSGQSEAGVTGTRRCSTLVAITKGNLLYTLMGLSYLATAPKRVRTRLTSWWWTIAAIQRVWWHHIYDNVVFTVSKKEQRGLTDSWNIAFEHAVRWKYEKLFLVNNDALLSPMALELMQDLLRSRSGGAIDDSKRRRS